MLVQTTKFQPATTSFGAGTTPNLPCDNMGVPMFSEYHPRYSMPTFSRQIFSAANPAGITSTAMVVGTTTAFLGFCLSNPVGSLVNLHLLKVGYSAAVAPAASATIFLVTGFNSTTSVTHTVPLTVRNNFIGVGASGVGLVDSSFSVPAAAGYAPNLILGTVGTVAPSIAPMVLDLEGSLILPPGGYAFIGSLVAGGASGAFGSASWVELPI